jgi:hypothetical protein
MRKRIVVQVAVCDEDDGSIEHQFIDVYESAIYPWEVKAMFEKAAARVLALCGVTDD